MPQKKELYSLISYDDIHFANVNNAQSKRTLIRTLKKNLLRRSPLRNYLFNLLTLGVYSYRIKKFATLVIQNELAKRKVRHVKHLHQEIEIMRKEETSLDPRDGINQIFMKIQGKKSEDSDRGVEYKKIFTPNELLLFITTPENDPKFIRKPKALLNNDEYLRIWRELRRNTKNKQFHQIDKINTCFTILKTEFGLTQEQINDRIHRTGIGKTHPEQLTRLKDLLKSFQEIVMAFQTLDELQEDDFSLYKTLTFFTQLSDEEVILLEKFVENEKMPKDLPAAAKKTMIKIANQTDVIDRIAQKDLAHTVELILNTNQWNLFLNIQNPSHSTLKLLDWAYHETISHTPEGLSFIDTFNQCRITKTEESKYKELFDIVHSNETIKEMCSFFANEIHREWPSILFFAEKKEVYFTDKVEDLSAEKLLEIFTALKNLSLDDNTVLTYLEGALSQDGKNLLQQRLQGNLNDLLGEPSEYYIPVFNIAHIAIAKHEKTHYDVTYYFRQKMFKKGENKFLSEGSEDIPLTLSLVKQGNEWSAHLFEKKVT